MKIIEKFRAWQAAPFTVRQPVLAFLGDSVTHGCFETFMTGDKMECEMHPDKVYHEKVRSILATLYPEVPVTVVNGGISGDYAAHAKERLDRDILFCAPDLVVVCFGLNDATRGEKGLPEFSSALTEIFTRVRASGAEAIFLTPNLRTEKLDSPFSWEILNKTALQVAENEKAGWLKKYTDAAREVCRKEQVPVCDCQKLWETLKAADVDINRLLANRINHPTADMHWMFAYELVKTMFEA